MKFIADDGKIFDTMEECEEYETKTGAISLAHYWHDNITMLNEAGRIVEPNIDPTHDPDYLKHLASFLERDEVCYLIIPKQCDNDVQWEKLCDFIDNEYSVNITISSGIWHWEEYEWRNFENDYRDFMNKWKPIERYLPNMNAH